MADESVDTTAETAEAGDQQDVNGFEAITSQESLDKIIQSRLSRERAKFEPLSTENEDLKRRLAEVGTASDALGAAERRVSELEATLAGAESENLRHTVAADTGVPFSLLSGSTREELDASAKAIQDYRDSVVPHGTYVPSEGRATDTNPKGDERAAARALFAKE